MEAEEFLDTGMVGIQNQKNNKGKRERYEVL